MGQHDEQSDSERTIALGSGSRSGPLPRSTRLGNYMLVELLGQGAMGQVYKAEQLEPVRRTVAVKLLAAGRVDGDLLARFDAERQALARMSHANIAQVFDAGRSADGQPYFVMEYVPGPTLIEYCNARALDLDARLQLFDGICGALAHAHQKGIIHRDIKPSNILVTEVDGRPVPKVIDFGLAKAVDGYLADRTLHTHIGTVLGTPAFMSPEQAALTGAEVDTRSDIYALGLVLYRLLTGTLPFNRVGEHNSTIEQVLRAVREDDPMRPSARVAALADGELPAGLDRGIIKVLREDLDWIILKCLVKRPEGRYQSVNDLLVDLRRFSRHLPVRARRSTAGYLLTKAARRYRVQLLVAAVVVALAVVLGGGWLSSRSNAAAQVRAAQRFGAAVQQMESRLRVAHTIPAHDISPVRKRIRADIDRLGQDLPDMEAWAQGPAHYAIGRGLLALDQPAEALDQLKSAWEGDYREPSVAYALGLAYGKMYEDARRHIANITNPEEHAQRLQEAQAQWRDPALGYLREGAENGADSVAYGRALIAFYESDFERTRALAEEAVAAEPWLYEAVVLVGDSWSREASHARESGQDVLAVANYAKAEQAYRHAATIGESDPSPYLSLCTMAGDHLRLVMYGSGGDAKPVFQGGREACEQAIAIDPQSAESLARLANLELMYGQIAEDNGEDARATYRQALDAASRAIALNPKSALAHVVAGTAWQRIAIYQLEFADENPLDALHEAAEYYHKTQEIDSARSDIYNELGNVYSIRGEYLAQQPDADPMPDLLEAVEQYKTGIEINPHLRVVQSNLAFNYTIIANYLVAKGEDPAPWFQQAFEVYEHILAGNPNLLLARLNLAATATHRGNHARDMGEDPLPWWQKAVEQLDRIIVADPESYSAWSVLAEVESARAAYLRDTGADPIDAARSASKAARKAIAIRETADNWAYLGQALRILADKTAAGTEAVALRGQSRDAFRKALAIDPGHVAAKAGLAGHGVPPASS